MKKLMALVFVLAVSCGYAFSFPLSIGIKAGVAVSDFSGTDASTLGTHMSGDAQSSLKSKLSLVGGAGLNLGVGGAWSIGPELLYVRKGTSIKTPQGDADVNLNYLEIPVLLKLNLIPSKTGLSPFICAGPSLNFNTSAKLSAPTGSQDIKDGVNSSDFGLVLGAGFDVQKFSLEARYELGLGSPFKAGAGGFTPSVHNGTLYILAGYRFM